MGENKCLLKMENISKSFPGVQALKNVNLTVNEGEVHALVGENGAGKSTLMKCLIGIHPPTEGKIWFDGRYIENYDTRKALEMHISMIHQELSPVESRPIMENIWLGREPKNALGFVDHKKMYDMTVEALALIDMHEDPNILMKDLTVAKKQMIEIAKAVSYNAKLIIMDEPTSALTDGEVEQLFKVIRKLKSEGRGIIYISHKLDEIYTICDAITVFRDGNLIGSKPTSEMKMDEMIRMMVGREVEDLFPKVVSVIGDKLLEVKDFNKKGLFENISFSVRKGEILGFAGLVGSGRTEVMETVFGARKKDKGQVFINGKEVEIDHPIKAIHNGLALLTEDRRGTGIFPMLSVHYNMVCSNIDSYKKGIFLDLKKMDKDVDANIKSISIKTPTPETPIGNLSGGNQQKVLIARWLLNQPDVLILDEPTKGIDVGAKAEIYNIISHLASAGKCVIMISSELPEILGMSDRIVVMHEGKINAILENKNLNQEIIMRYATGEQKQTMQEIMQAV